jgi:hypothetical protein
VRRSIAASAPLWMALCFWGDTACADTACFQQASTTTQAPPLSSLAARTGQESEESPVQLNEPPPDDVQG